MGHSRIGSPGYWAALTLGESKSMTQLVVVRQPPNREA